MRVFTVSSGMPRHSAVSAPVISTEVLTASVRSPMHVVQAALIGSHCATLPMSVIRQLIKHPLTDVGLATFLEDNKKASADAK
jgi:transaldolase